MRIHIHVGPGQRCPHVNDHLVLARIKSIEPHCYAVGVLAGDWSLCAAGTGAHGATQMDGVTRRHAAWIRPGGLRFTDAGAGGVEFDELVATLPILEHGGGIEGGSSHGGVLMIELERNPHS